MRTRIALMILILTALLMAACERQGPAERAGEQIDEAAEEVADAAEEACEDAKDAAGADDTDC